MYRCKVMAIVAFLATLIFIICVGNMAVFPARKATVIAFTTTSSILTNPRTSRTRCVSSLWSMPPPHPHLPPEASRQHVDFVSIKNPIAPDRRSFIQHGLISTIGLNALTTSLSSFVTNRDVVNAMEIDTSVLRPATEDQPQIPFPDISALKEMEAATTLEGLVYLKYPKSERRPKSNDVIVLSIQTTTEPDIIVAGALVPVSRIPSSGFPFQFRINGKNAIPSSKSSLLPQDNWNYVMKNNDLLVRAVVCNRDTIGFDNGSSSKNRDIYQVLEMCQTAVAEPDTSALMSTSQWQQSQAPLSGQGIAKLIRYTGSGEDSTKLDSVIIRAPVSLPLG